MLSDKKYGLSVNIMATRVMPSLLPQTVNPSLNLEQFTILLEVSGNARTPCPAPSLHMGASICIHPQPTATHWKSTCARRVLHMQQMCSRARVWNIHSHTHFAGTEFSCDKIKSILWLRNLRILTIEFPIPVFSSARSNTRNSEIIQGISQFCLRRDVCIGL